MNSNYCKIDEILASIASQKQTGELIYSNNEKQYILYFVMGYLRYGTGGSDRARRWYRAVKKHCPNFAEEKLKKLEEKEPWEYQLLCQGLSENKLTLPQIRTILNSSIKEVLFSILVSSNLTSNWTATKHQPLPFRTLLLKSDEVLASVQQLVEQSNGLNLSEFSPELAPVVKHSTDNKTEIMGLFDGSRTFWDLASHLKHPVTEIIRICIPRYTRGLMELRTIEDLSPPIPLVNVTETSEANCFSAGGKQYCIEQERDEAQDTSLDKSYKPLIACVDDSLAMCLTLEKIILPAGYRALKIQNPLEKMSELVKSKPDLIILDLMMPDVNGYDLCKFLRQTPSFKKVPIVILTSSNDLIDIAKSKMVGASDFLNKPPQPEKVLEVIKKHLVSKDLANT